MVNNLYKNRNFGPMLLSEIKEPFDDKDYLFELKYDGIRALIFASPKEVVIKSRNNYDITFLYPELQSIKNLVKKNCIFDGEIVLLENGLPSFLALQKRAHLKNKLKIAKEAEENPVIFMSFDILYEDKDLTNCSLLERKQKLAKYQDTEEFIKSKYIMETGKKLFKFAQKHQIEGIVAKEIHSKYETDIRTKKWLKIKNMKEEDFYIVGYQEKIGAITLIVAQLKKGKFVYSGKVLLYENHPAYQKIRALKKKSYQVENINEDFIKITPKYQATIIYLEKTKSGNLRHPVFKELKG